MQQEFFGLGAITQLKKILAEIKPKSIFLVTGKQSYHTSGAQALIQPLLASYQTTQFSDFQVNPKLEDIQRGITLFQKNDCDLILAVGGGSVIDTAKAINSLAAQPDSPEKYVRGQSKITQTGKPFIAIPTTSGTGSEATHFAVVYIGKEKYSLAYQLILPNYVIIDPQFTFQLPKKITAETGMDALAQAIESYWSVNSTEESKQYSREAIKLILSNLETCVNHPNEESRIAMARAANLAGKAINIAKTTACHAVSYPITSYFGVPHGHAVALTLPSMFIYNTQVAAEDCQDHRGLNYVQSIMQELIKLLHSQTPQQAAEKITQLMQSIGLETTLSQLKITTSNQLALIIAHGFNPERVKNNPRKLDESNLRRILLALT